MTAYYNEIDPYAAQWLRNLIAAGHIAPGEVDERSIVDVRPDDLHGFTQCHFFAGIGGWSLGARLAGWPDDRELWTGSCPCQPFSVAGKQAGQADERHLWPEQFRLIRARRPAIWMGEQVAAAVGKHWLDGVHSDLESIGYASRAVIVPACAVDAPHRRDRAWIVADAGAQRRDGIDPLLRRYARGRSPSEVHEIAWSGEGLVADTSGGRRAGSGQGQGEQPGRTEVVGAGQGNVADAVVLGQPRVARRQEAQRNSMGSKAWSNAEWLAGADGKARRFEPSIRLLAHGVPARVGKLRAYGNAIVPPLAAEIIGAYLDAA